MSINHIINIEDKSRIWIIQQYFYKQVQRLWRNIVSVDRVFSANVLAKRLDPASSNSNGTEEALIAQIKRNLVKLEELIKPILFK